jgi:hypothetical protein
MARIAGSAVPAIPPTHLGGLVKRTVSDEPKSKKPYQAPRIVHVERIEARAVVCSKQVGDDFCEQTAPVTS